MNIDKNLIKYWSYLCENKDEEYDDFIPDDDYDGDDLKSKAFISALDKLSKTFKKNPDEGLKYLTKYKKDLGEMFEAISSIIQENLKKLESLRKQLRAAIFKPSSDNGPFSFDNCYMVSQKQGFNDKDGLYAYVETRDEALRLFNALKSSSGGKTLQVFEITKDDEKIIKQNH